MSPVEGPGTLAPHSADIVDLRALAVGDDSDTSLTRLLAMRDQAVAALDRAEAALDRHRAAEYLRQSYRDQLTGALQRDSGRDRLQAEVDRCHRRGESLVIAFVDVDHLKRTNDERGHAAGDALLKAVGRALYNGLRSYDLVVRYGGDEFVCAMAGAHTKDAELRMQQVQRILNASVPGATISVGLAMLQEDETLDAAIGRADRDLYAGRYSRPRRDEHEPGLRSTIGLPTVFAEGPHAVPSAVDDVGEVKTALDDV
jgi:diguanylate cyclase (GGDEF)-like protein